MRWTGTYSPVLAGPRGGRRLDRALPGKPGGAALPPARAASPHCGAHAPGRLRRSLARRLAHRAEVVHRDRAAGSTSPTLARQTAVRRVDPAVLCHRAAARTVRRAGRRPYGVARTTESCHADEASGGRRASWILAIAAGVHFPRKSLCLRLMPPVDRLGRLVVARPRFALARHPRGAAGVARDSRSSSTESADPKGIGLSCWRVTPSSCHSPSPGSGR